MNIVLSLYSLIVLRYVQGQELYQQLAVYCATGNPQLFVGNKQLGFSNSKSAANENAISC